MKYAGSFVLLVALIGFMACTNNNQTAQSPAKPGEKIEKDMSVGSAATNSVVAKEITPTITNINPAVATSFKEVVGDYLHIKNALAADNASEAASSGKALTEVLEKIDPAQLSPEQKKLYTENADDLKENAEHISKNADKIAHQREHFAMMSEDVYDLVKGFGGGQTLYLDHCPMAQDKKGANWLSEIKEIHNPYLGAKMPDCGSVEAVVKQ